MVLTAILIVALILLIWLVVGGLVLLGLGAGGTFGLIFIVLATGAVVRFVLTAQRAAIADVLSSIQAAMGLSLPLPEALRAAAAGAGGARGRWLGRTADALEAGEPLSKALAVACPSCPGHILAMLASAERVHRLPAALEALQAQLEADRRERMKFRPVDPAYPVVLLFWMLPIVLVLPVFILPRFRDLFAGMGVRLPAVTEALMDAGSAIPEPAPVVVFVLMALILPLYTYTLFRPRRPQSPRLLSRLGDRVKWYTPVLYAFERNQSLTDVSACLRLALGAGATVDAAIAAAAELDTNAVFRDRLRGWLGRVRGGQDPSAAARAAGVGRPLAWAFDTKVNPSGALNVLETMESVYRSAHSYAASLARTIFWPCVVLVAAGFVGLVAAALILPMATLVQAACAAAIP